MSTLQEIQVKRHQIVEFIAAKAIISFSRSQAAHGLQANGGMILEKLHPFTPALAKVDVDEHLQGLRDNTQK